MLGAGAWYSASSQQFSPPSQRGWRPAPRPRPALGATCAREQPVSSPGGGGAPEQPTGSRSDFLTVRNEIPQGDSKGNEAGTLRASRPAALPVAGTRFLNKVGRVRAREGKGLTCAPEARKAHQPQGRPLPDLGHPSSASCTPFVPILALHGALGFGRPIHLGSNPASLFFTHKGLCVGSPSFCFPFGQWYAQQVIS